MTPGARIQAAIEILDAWMDQGFPPPEEGLRSYFRQRRFIGSKDRRTIRELFFRVLRHPAQLRWWAEYCNLPPTGRSFLLLSLPLLHLHSPEQVTQDWQTGQYAPASLTDAETRALSIAATPTPPKMPDEARLNVPTGMLPSLQNVYGDRLESELAALQTEAPTDLRVNTLKTDRPRLLSALARHGIQAQPTPHVNTGLRMNGHMDLQSLPEFTQGWFEVQDEASQRAVHVAGPRPGDTIIDFCAGSGGKALAMAALMHNHGTIHCWDSHAGRLARMDGRAARAGVSILRTAVLPEAPEAFLAGFAGFADGVLVDAPCSGSGTWRRNPHLRWRYAQSEVLAFTQTQQAILAQAAALVKEGGWLLYASCSLYPEENEAQVAAFLQNHQEFHCNPPDQQRYSPASDGCDGFFACRLQRTN